jgi:hypothetical protein
MVLHETVAASKKKTERILYLKVTTIILNSDTVEEFYFTGQNCSEIVTLILSEN